MGKAYLKVESRDKALLQSMGATLGIKAGSVLVSMWAMPVYLDFFREETVLGCWFTVWSMLSWLLNLDFGLGNGLRNYLAQALARGERHKAGECLAAAYASMGGICLLTAAVFFAVFPRLDWNGLLRIGSISPKALKLAVGIGFVGILGQLFLRPITGILYAMQLSAVNSLLGLCTSALAVLGIFLMPSGSDDQNLIAMASVQALAAVLPLLGATAAVFSGKTIRALRPAPGRDSAAAGKRLWTLGGGFFLVQTAYMLMMNTNEYLITILTDAASVVEYQIYYKLLLLGSSFFSLALTPVWSAVTRAVARKEYAWTKQLYKKLLCLAIAASAGVFAMIPLLQPVADLWLGEQSIAVRSDCGFWVGALGALLIWNSVLSSVANGLGQLKVQAICFLGGAAAKLPLAELLTGFWGSWAGVAAANVLVLLPYCIAEPIVLANYFRRQANLNE